MSEQLDDPQTANLNNVALRNVAPRGAKRRIVRIQNVHLGKVGRANANDDDGHRQIVPLDNLVHRRLQIIQHTVGENQQNLVVLLVCSSGELVLMALHHHQTLRAVLGHLKSLAKHLGKDGRAIQRNSVEGLRE